MNWLSNDILAKSGPEAIERLELFDFIVTELKAREELCPHRIRPLRTTLENQRDALLAFARVLDTKLAEIALSFEVPLYLVRQICLLQNQFPSTTSYWQTSNQLSASITRKVLFFG